MGLSLLSVRSVIAGFWENFEDAFEMDVDFAETPTTSTTTTTTEDSAELLGRNALGLSTTTTSAQASAAATTTTTSTTTTPTTTTKEVNKCDLAFSYFINFLLVQ